MRHDGQHCTYQELKKLIDKADRILVNVSDCAGNAATSVEVDHEKLIAMLSQSSSHCFIAKLDEGPKEKVLWID